MSTAPAPEHLLVGVPGHPGATLRVEVHHPHAPVVALFSSGLGLPLDLWHPVVDLLPDVRCVLFDRPGMGGSTPWHRVVDLSEEVDLLSTVLAACHPDPTTDPVVVVGHSHGGLFAEGLARTRPEVVRGLVLVDASDPGLEATRLQLGGPAALVAAWVAARPWLAPLAKDVAATTVLVGGTTRPASAPARSALVTAYGQPAQLEATVAELAAVGDDARALVALAHTHPLPDVPVAARRRDPGRPSDPAPPPRVAAPDDGPCRRARCRHRAHRRRLRSPRHARRPGCRGPRRAGVPHCSRPLIAFSMAAISSSGSDGGPMISDQAVTTVES